MACRAVVGVRAAARALGMRRPRTITATSATTTTRAARAALPRILRCTGTGYGPLARAFASQATTAHAYSETVHVPKDKLQRSVWHYFRRAYEAHDFSVIEDIFAPDVRVTFIGGGGDASGVAGDASFVGKAGLYALCEQRIAPLSTDGVDMDIEWDAGGTAEGGSDAGDADANAVSFVWHGKAAIEGRPDITVAELAARNTWTFGRDGKVTAVDVELRDASWHARQWTASCTALAATEGLEVADVVRRAFQPFSGAGSDPQHQEGDAASADPALDPSEAAKDTLWRRFEVAGPQPTPSHSDKPATWFFDKADYPWHSELEAATDMIRDEFTQLPGAIPPVVAFKDYNGRQTWRKYVLFFLGVPVEPHVAACPRTAALLRAAIGPDLIGAEFMVLEPHSELPRHNNCIFLDFVRCHLGVVVPPNCAMSVMNEVRPWAEGQMMFFDDTLPHQAWNRSDERRIILNVDVKRSSLADSSAEAVCAAQTHHMASLLNEDGQFAFRLDGLGTYHCTPPDQSLGSKVAAAAAAAAATRSDGADGSGSGVVVDAPEPLPGVSQELFDAVFAAFYPGIPWRS